MVNILRSVYNKVCIFPENPDDYEVEILMDIDCNLLERRYRHLVNVLLIMVNSISLVLLAMCFVALSVIL